MTEAMRQARERGVLERLPLFDRLTETGAVWSDGRTVEADTILYATGFRAAIDHLAPLGLREPGGGIRLDGTRAVRDPRVHLVGYGPSASTIGANRAGRAAVRDIRQLLRTDDSDQVRRPGSGRQTSAPGQRQHAQAEHQDAQREMDRRDVRDAEHDLGRGEYEKA